MTQGRRHALSESPLEQAGPFLSARECPVLWVFVLADVSPCQASSSFFYPSFLSSTHSFKPSKFSSTVFFFFYTGFYSGGSFAENSRQRVGMLSHLVFDSEDTAEFLQEICVFVKVLSASSWNYLGAKLIALDPTSRCNRLSVNLGFSQCSQVSSGQRRCTELSTALFS